MSATKTKEKAADHCWKNLLLPTFGMFDDDVESVVKKLTGGAKSLLPPLPPVLVSEHMRVVNLKVHPDMSQETNCFSGEIVFRGKKVMAVSNEGCGGDMRCYPIGDKRHVEEFEDWVKTLPAMSSFDSFYIGVGHLASTEARSDMITPMTAEQLVDLFVTRWLMKADTRPAGKFVMLAPKGCDIGIYKYKNAVANKPKTEAEKKQLVSLLRVLAARSNSPWAVPAFSLNDMPLYYYPCPHKVYSALGRDIIAIHKNSKAYYVVDSLRTCDRTVHLGTKRCSSELAVPVDAFEKDYEVAFQSREFSNEMCTKELGLKGKSKKTAAQIIGERYVELENKRKEEAAERRRQWEENNG